MSHVKTEILTIAVEKLLSSWSEPYMQEVAQKARISEARIQTGRDMLQQCVDGRAELAMLFGTQTQTTAEKDALKLELRQHISDLKQSIKDSGMSNDDLRKLGIYPSYRNLVVQTESSNAPDGSPAEAENPQPANPEPETEGDAETRTSRRRVRNSREEQQRNEWTMLFANIHKLPEPKILELAEHGWSQEFLTQIGSQVQRYVELCDLQDQALAGHRVASRKVRVAERELQDWYNSITQKVRRYATGMLERDTINGVAQPLHSYRVA